MGTKCLGLKFYDVVGNCIKLSNSMFSCSQTFETIRNLIVYCVLKHPYEGKPGRRYKPLSQLWQKRNVYQAFCVSRNTACFARVARDPLKILPALPPRIHNKLFSSTEMRQSNHFHCKVSSYLTNITYSSGACHHFVMECCESRAYWLNNVTSL